MSVSGVTSRVSGINGQVCNFSHGGGRFSLIGQICFLFGFIGDITFISVPQISEFSIFILYYIILFLYSIRNIYPIILYLVPFHTVCTEPFSETHAPLTPPPSPPGQQGVREVISRDSFCATEVEIFRAVSRWTAANPDSDAAQLLAAVRLPLVSMQVSDPDQWSGLVRISGPHQTVSVHSSLN